jgi:2-C-methyl-D-erythritol 4-phosphate cytidylyltransferase
MNIAVIFAGGVGTRMKTSDLPKQFLMVHGKPIIVHTIEIFQNHPEIDGIICVCVEGWIDYMEELKYRYRLEKIAKIVPGGETGQLSIYNGLKAAAASFGLNDNVVLIHDGVRPLISAETITANIASVKANGSAITSVPAQETVIVVDDDEQVQEIVERSHARLARAPQSFYLKEILEAQETAISQGLTNMTDSCTLMKHFGKKLYTIPGERNNIKITTPEDFYTFRALSDAKENEQLDITKK